jgi:hypothetical protein
LKIPWKRAFENPHADFVGNPRIAVEIDRDIGPHLFVFARAGTSICTGGAAPAAKFAVEAERASVEGLKRALKSSGQRNHVVSSSRHDGRRSCINPFR